MALWSCSSSSKTPPSSTSKGSDESSVSREAKLLGPRQRFQPLAVGGDGFPRMTKVFAEGTQKLERIDFDFNADGRVDFIQYFDPTGAWVRKEASDLDGDGLFDVLSTFDKKGAKAPELVAQEFNARYENRPSVWKEYRNGVLAKRALDRKGRGRPDYWEIYEGERLLRVERDDDGDGQPDKGARFPRVVAPEGSEPGRPKLR